MEMLTERDKEKYLQAGALTKPFLDKEYVLEMVLRDYQRKREQGKDVTKLESLYNWIAFKMKGGDPEFKKKYRFQRDAKQIWESGLITGCSDYAMLFATFARQLGYPTTFLHTATLGWLKNFQSGIEQDKHLGHSFCECFYEGKWVLVDPTYRHIVFDYDQKKIVLPYPTSEGNVFVPYFRGLDLGKKQTLQDHNLQMASLCKDIDLTAQE